MKMSKMKLSAMAGFLAFALTSAMFVSPVYAADSPNTIVVTGTGAVHTQPDIAHASLGVETRDADPRVAQTRNNELVASVIETMRSLGIDEADMQTTNFFMFPVFDHGGMRVDPMGNFEQHEPRIIGYSVSNTVRVTIRNLDIAGDVLSAAVAAGANVAGGIQFGLQDSSALYHQALALAINDAAGRAQSIAQALGKNLGTPVAVVENSGWFMPMARAEAFAMGMAADGSVPVQAGELTVTASVQVTYSFTP
jgi:uncharacterized protein YggE